MRIIPFATRDIRNAVNCKSVASVWVSHFNALYLVAKRSIFLFENGYFVTAVHDVTK